MSLILMGLGQGGIVSFGIGDTIVLLIDELPADVSIVSEPQGKSRRRQREKNRDERYMVEARLAVVPPGQEASFFGTDAATFDARDRFGAKLVEAYVTQLGNSLLIEASLASIGIDTNASAVIDVSKERNDVVVEAKQTGADIENRIVIHVGRVIARKA